MPAGAWRDPGAIERVGRLLERQGSVYLTGLFQQAADFAGTRLVEAGNGDAFVMKIAGVTLP